MMKTSKGAQWFTRTNYFLNWLDSYGWTKVEENQ